MSAVDPEDSPVALRIVSGHPSDEELAAVFAVVSDAFTQEQIIDPTPSGLNRWQLSARATRGELNQLAGWNGYGRINGF